MLAQKNHERQGNECSRSLHIESAVVMLLLSAGRDARCNAAAPAMSNAVARAVLAIPDACQLPAVVNSYQQPRRQRSSE